MTDKIDPNLTAIEAAVQALVAQTNRLGVSWQLNYATTTDSSTSSSAWTVVLDGDEAGNSIDAISLIGLAPDGSRVAVLSLPSGLNYVIDLLAANPLSNAEATSIALGSGTTTSGSYSNLAVSPLTFTKQVPNSRLRVDMSVSMFSTIASTKVRIGVQVGSTDYDIISFLFSQANVVGPVVGSNIISVTGSGSLSIQPRWLRVSGTGTLTVSSAEDISMVVTEVN